jgi:hypothetical protein
MPIYIVELSSRIQPGKFSFIQKFIGDKKGGKK